MLVSAKIANNFIQHCKKVQKNIFSLYFMCGEDGEVVQAAPHLHGIEESRNFALETRIQKMTSGTKAVIFDLDGTLTDTLTDLADSTNFALGQLGMPVRTKDEVRRFVGNGVEKLIERAVPEGTCGEATARCLDLFRSHYVRHCKDNTRLYPHVKEMLDTLHEQGYHIAIVSNKLQAGVDELFSMFFAGGAVDIAIGERQGIRRKPAPDMLLLALSALGVECGEAVYVGDSDVDIETARNAGVPCVSVLWGFRDKDFLLAHGAVSLASSPEDVVRLVNARATMA